MTCMTSLGCADDSDLHAVISSLPQHNHVSLEEIELMHFVISSTVLSRAEFSFNSIILGKPFWKPSVAQYLCNLSKALMAAVAVNYKPYFY